MRLWHKCQSLVTRQGWGKYCIRTKIWRAGVGRRRARVQVKKNGYLRAWGNAAHFGKAMLRRDTITPCYRMLSSTPCKQHINLFWKKIFERVLRCQHSIRSKVPYESVHWATTHTKRHRWSHIPKFAYSTLSALPIVNFFELKCARAAAACELAVRKSLLTEGSKQ